MKTIWFRARMWLANRLLDLGASPQFARWVAHLPAIWSSLTSASDLTPMPADNRGGFPANLVKRRVVRAKRALDT